MTIPTNIHEKELPLYQCHKKVRALKIKEIRVHSMGLDVGKFTIVPEDQNFKPFDVDREYMRKHNPKSGGYFVVYEDGYQSFSPAKAFEEGYTLL